MLGIAQSLDTTVDQLLYDNTPVLVSKFDADIKELTSDCSNQEKEFLLEMKDAIAPELDFIFGDIPYTGVNQPLEDFDCSKLEADTGFKAEVGFAEGCKKTRDWWVEVLREEKE